MTSNFDMQNSQCLSTELSQTYIKSMLPTDTSEVFTQQFIASSV